MTQLRSALDARYVAIFELSLGDIGKDHGPCVHITQKLDNNPQLKGRIISSAVPAPLYRFSSVFRHDMTVPGDNFGLTAYDTGLD
jgi:hypothetical protein